MPMTDAEFEAHHRDATRVLQDMTEEQRQAVLQSVRGTLAAEDMDLDPDDVELLLASMRGDITHDQFLEIVRRGWPA